jgi:hypothetical protein
MAKRQSAKQEAAMKDEHYDLISVLYHALQGEETVGRYIGDAEDSGDSELAEHYRDVHERYHEIAQQTKELLRDKLAGDELDEEEEEEED